MVVVDPHFKNAGKKAGLEIWRIKKFAVEPVDPQFYGNFYEGDSYIVLKTKENREWDVHFWLGDKTTQTNEIENVNHLLHEVHFWLGSAATEDEYGTAAIKTVELDELLGGGPVQHREIQGHESPLFSSYFKDGIKYLKGGHESGFRKVNDEKPEPRLFQCKGKRNVRVWQVELRADSLNKGDVFILDQGTDIYVWIPPNAGNLERIKGMEVAKNIKDRERVGRTRAILHVVDNDWETNPPFWSKLGGSAKQIKPAEAGGADEEMLRTVKPKLILWKVSDASGKMEISKIAEQDLSSDALDSKDAFILDTGREIFVWVGKSCTMEERQKAMSYAQKYLQDTKRPSHTQVTRVIQGGEPAYFTQWFTKSAAGKTKCKARLFECSDESGKLVVTEIENFAQKDLDGDDVMMLDVSSTIYVWIGHKASDNEKTSAKGIAQKYLDTDTLPRPGGVKIVQINQGEEPQEFKQAFPKWDPGMHKQTVEEMKKLTIGK